MSTYLEFCRQAGPMNYPVQGREVVFNLACSLRLTNVYGPPQLIRHSRHGFIGGFIRQAVEGREIQISGDGSQVRDFVCDLTALLDVAGTGTAV